MEKLLIFGVCSQGHGFTGAAGVVVVVILGGPSIGASGWLISYKNSGIIGTETNATMSIKFNWGLLISIVNAQENEWIDALSSHEIIES